VETRERAGLSGWPLFWLVATLGVLASLARYAVRTQQLDLLRDEVATRYAQMEATHQYLAAQLSATPDVRAREATLQAEWNLVGPDERAVQVIPETPATPQNSPRRPTPVPTATQAPPWYWWWLLFFGPLTTPGPPPSP